MRRLTATFSIMHTYSRVGRAGALTFDLQYIATQKISFGHGWMMAQSSGPFFIVLMSGVSPPRRSSHFFTFSG